tara:strand:- start:10052 stop:10228 length:177 start_codon:yes stop_codon:yes gene_type:complete
MVGLHLTKSMVGLILVVFALFLIATILLSEEISFQVFAYSVTGIFLYFIAVYHFKLIK